MVAIDAPIHISNDDTLLGYVDGYCIQRVLDQKSIQSEWEELQKAGTACIYQNYDWTRIAYETIERNHTPYLITGRNEDGLQFILPMTLETSYIKLLRWAGSTHANICSGLYSEHFLKTANADVITQIFKTIKKSIGGIGLSRLGNQPYYLKGYANPMQHLPNQKSVNMMYNMDLLEGLDKILDFGNGKRKRKLWRKQQRVAEAMGGYELYIPKTREEILEALNEFRTIKSERFQQLGIFDVFASQEAIDFLDALATEPIKDGIQPFRIFQLKVDGKTRAMYGSAILKDYCQSCINAVSYDDFSDQSPGEMIMYAMVQHLIDEGFSRLDLGVGDERYKRSWCPEVHTLFDTIMPLSIWAIPVMKAIQFMLHVKRYLRNNESLWKHYKKLRKLKAPVT